ncbi:MerR family transcriptional regulator [Tsukamurella pulmonis]|uniref:DNA-binding transcriptional regulator, MerR family n=1 Tax=Tsukamurella pulmonis TaxID=47312 RepID=A0A1H1FLG3_9ACTN|nr:HEAT repeat domain-containing protein [Tsukamurella pulmonis]KXO87570.1 MerR family transcriptional regulator [Tsukamurella pulmonis]SDR01658.1 DNA-binding transcriptional regulator, MerR family [Tsukamurella pulmonis]SUP19237.1 HTH-type transcriptional activator tipA [Tsukamurella pulmonis]
MRIGEVAERSGVSARMLRHYDALGLVRPSQRSSTGYREYAPEDIRRIFHVESLRSLGLSLKEIGRALDDPSFAPERLLEDMIARSRERIRLEVELFERLQHVAATGPSDWEQVLAVVGLLSRLDTGSPGARQRAVLAAGGRAPSDALAEALLREESTNVAGALRWALAQADGPDLAPLVDALGSEDAAVRRRAVEALAEVPGQDEALRSALEHEDAAVRVLAAVALGRRGDAAAVPALIEMVRTGRKDVDAAEALGVIATITPAPEAISTRLADIATTSTAYDERQRIVQALAEIRTDGADAALRDLARDGDARIAGTAAFILRRQER